MLFGSTSRRFGTISIFPSIPDSNLPDNAHSSERRTDASQPVAAEARVGGMGFSEPHSLSASLPAGWRAFS
jgi:hypothetical protein